jgi:transketolase
MGDQIGSAIEGTLYYVPHTEFERIRALPIGKIPMIEVFSNMARLNTLYMIGRAGSGHIGSSFSSMDMVSWLLLNELTEVDLSNNDAGNIYFSSKGHDAPGYYAALIGAGRMSFDLIHKLRRIDGLPGHPDINTECMETNTGSLGMGISKAKGMVIANRLNRLTGSIYLITGDGEIQEGQFWESLISGVNNNFHEIVTIIDHNKLQSDTYISQVSDLGDLEEKLKSFGWHVERIDGHDISSFASTLNKLKKIKDKPKVIIADTIKGKGVSFMEHTAMESDAEMYRFHSGAPDAESYTKAAQELIDTINIQLNKVEAEEIQLEIIERPVTAQQEKTQRLIPAYTEALLEQAEKHKNLVALDADLILDTGLIPFKEKFPDRFIECGIAEQDMVSQAGGMALKGLLPVVHSFACFLSTRPNEQIYNNATEKKKIIYVGSLAGLLPGGPGHSHQSVRDISALGGIPGLTLIEPSCEAEVAQVVDYAVNQNEFSTYIRLVSIPYSVPFELPDNYELKEGQGVALREGTDAVLFAYGPVMLSEAYLAAEILEKDYKFSLKVVNLPWLNLVDGHWLSDQIGEIRRVFTIDNHLLNGGQGQYIAATLSEIGGNKNLDFIRFGIEDIPACGTNSELLNHYGMNAVNLARKIVRI